MKVKKSLINIGVVSSFMFMLSGCFGLLAPKPEVLNEMKIQNVTMDQVCKGSNHWSKYDGNSEAECTFLFIAGMEDVAKGIKFKEFEDACKEYGTLVKYYNSSEHECRSHDRFKGKDYYFSESAELLSFLDAQKAKKEREKVAAEKAKVEKEIADAKAAEAKKIADAKAKKVAEARRIADAKAEKAASIKYAAERKEDERKKAEFEKNAKIKNGKQYHCSDGYDTWVLKYNGFNITFGNVNFIKNFYGFYQINEYSKNPLYIDRAKGTVSYNGNTSTCTPR